MEAALAEELGEIAQTEQHHEGAQPGARRRALLGRHDRRLPHQPAFAHRLARADAHGQPQLQNENDIYDLVLEQPWEDWFTSTTRSASTSPPSSRR
jgi:putative N6-adenine-specific DNA methylase